MRAIHRFYCLNGTYVEREDFYNAFEEYVYDTNEELYKEIIDADGEVEILGGYYEKSRILEMIDPIAYKVYYSDFVNGIYCDMVSELERSLEYDYFSIVEIDLQDFYDVGFTISNEKCDEITLINKGVEIIVYADKTYKNKGKIDEKTKEIIEWLDLEKKI